MQAVRQVELRSDSVGTSRSANLPELAHHGGFGHPFSWMSRPGSPHGKGRGLMLKAATQDASQAISRQTGKQKTAKPRTPPSQPNTLFRREGNSQACRAF